MTATPSTPAPALADEFARLRRATTAEAEAARGRLFAVFEAAILLLFAHIFCRLEQIVLRWQAGAVPGRAAPTTPPSTPSQATSSQATSSQAAPSRTSAPTAPRRGGYTARRSAGTQPIRPRSAHARGTAPRQTGRAASIAPPGLAGARAAHPTSHPPPARAPPGLRLPHQPRNAPTSARNATPILFRYRN